MRERGILFQAPLVRAILAGTKTQTRRLATPNQPIPADLRSFEMRKDPVFGRWVLGPAGCAMVPFFQAAHGWVSAAFGSPKYGVPGDRLWVRETWSTSARSVYPCPQCWYRADYGQYDDPAREQHIRGCGGNRGDCFACTAEREGKFVWRPSIFMPRWASRITLEIAEVRVQRLQDITEHDAKAEGVDSVSVREVPRNGTMFYRDDFAQLWDIINGKKASWDSNPWVWAITFRRLP